MDNTMEESAIKLSSKFHWIRDILKIELEWMRAKKELDYE